MPLLGEIFIDNVKSENVTADVTTTDHPIEEGVDITDHIERSPKVVSMSGVIVGSDSALRKRKIEQYKNDGAILKYSYRNVLDNVVITKFDTTHDAEVLNGVKFNMTIKVIRLAKPIITVNLSAKQKPKVKGKTNKGVQQTTSGAAAKVYVVKAGDSLSKIAAAYGVNMSKLYEKNKGIIGSDPNKIYPGQKLIIPNKG